MERIEWLQMFIGVLGGGSIVGTIVGFFTIPSMVKKASSEARKEEAEAKHAEISNMKDVADGWKELAEERQEACKEKDERIAALNKQIDERYTDIGLWRDKYNSKQEEVATLRVKIANDEVKMCQLRGCEKRTPPTGY